MDLYELRNEQKENRIEAERWFTWTGELSKENTLMINRSIFRMYGSESWVDSNNLMQEVVDINALRMIVGA